MAAEPVDNPILKRIDRRLRTERPTAGGTIVGGDPNSRLTPMPNIAFSGSG